TIRLARAINRAFGRRGKVFADRYHEHILKSPTEVRHAVEYVLHNRAKHLKKRGKTPHPWDLDPYSSMSGRAITFLYDYDICVPIVAAPETWLLRRAAGVQPFGLMELGPQRQV